MDEGQLIGAVERPPGLVGAIIDALREAEGQAIGGETTLKTATRVLGQPRAPWVHGYEGTRR